MDKNRIFALFLLFKSKGIEIVKTDLDEMKIFLVVPKGIEVEKLKNLVQFTYGKQMRVFVKQKGEA